MSTGEAGQVRKVLEVFRERPLSLDAERLEQRRARVVPRLRAEVRVRHAREVRRRRLRRFGSALALAATAALVIGLAWTRGAPEVADADGAELVVEDLGGEGALWRGAEQHRLAVGETLKGPVRGELRTAEGAWARLRTAQGLSLGLAGATAVDVAELRGVAGERRVFLARGELSCDVPKLPTGEKFVVVTPDARVVVHGTAFSVRVMESATCVRVQHGAVSVSRPGRTVVLRDGESAGCEASASAPAAVEAPKAPAATPVPSPERSAARATSKPAAAAGEPASTLAQETELLQGALSAERRGDLAAARRNLRVLLARYPSSPLADEAAQALERVSR
jgi:ferric-dicitrate binding protein FerR (iron transport regulator)